MRYLVVFAMLVGALALAPVAGAKEYEFVASDGTKCVLDITRAAAPEAGGTWASDTESAVSCNRPVLQVEVGDSLDDDPDESGYVNSDYESCNNDWFFDIGICDAFPVSAGLNETGLAAGEYVHGSSVFLVLKDDPAPGWPVWLVVPTHDDHIEDVRWGTQCVPGGNGVSCDFRESFTLG